MSPTAESTVALSNDPAAPMARPIASSQIAGLLLDLTVRVIGLTIIAAALIVTSATLLGAR